MRSLVDLLATGDGRELLAGRGIFVEVEPFIEAMRPPADDRLRAALGLGDGTCVPYVGQQLQCDYARPTTAKFRLAQVLALHDGISPISLPLDVDRAGSSRWNTTLTWPIEVKPPTVRIIANRVAELEMRFAPVEPDRVQLVISTVDAWLVAWAGTEQPGDVVRARQAGFIQALTRPEPRTLSDANRALTEWLLRDGLGYEPPTMLVSQLLDAGLVTGALNRVIAVIDDIIGVFNEARAELVASDVDPQVRDLAPNYLPLRYACPQDGKRCLLVRERRGRDTFAVATCRFCGTVHQFHLGSHELDVAPLVATGRWGTDVTLPVYMNALTSGVIAGQSTALYGMVLNRVLMRVLGETPVPVLVPAGLLEPPDPGGGSLFFDCLTASA
jgi:hypothetical protein